MKERKKQIKKEIDALQTIIGKKKTEYFRKNIDMNTVSMERYDTIAEEEIEQSEILQEEYRQITAVQFKPLSENGTLFELDEWLECVNDGGFIDYDGFGYYALIDKQSNKLIQPSHVGKFPIRDTEFTHVMWFNR